MPTCMCCGSIGSLLRRPQEYSLFVGDLTPEVDDYILYNGFSKYKSCFAVKGQNQFTR